MPGLQFIGRLLKHVLSSDFKRIRHYGLLAMPQANPRAVEEVREFMRRVAAIEIDRCAHCKLGHWRVVEQRGADRAAIAAAMPTGCRGPP